VTLKPVDYDKHFVIGTPLVGWKCDRGEHLKWIENSHAVIEQFPNAKFFAALELDSRGLEPFTPVLNALQQVDGEHWTYTINDHETVVNSKNRWIRIETGRNLIREFAQRKRVMSGHHWGEETPQYTIFNYDAVLYVDSDMMLTPLLIEKLFEVDRPLVGVYVPQYNLHGPVVCSGPLIKEHWTTAGMLLVNAPAYYDLPWYHNAYLNLSDDPTFQHLAERLPYGQTWVRHDIEAHHLGQLVAVEDRGIPPRQP
jgi:hypothetical protein